MSENVRVGNRTSRGWRWVAVATAVLLVGAPIALAGLYVTGDLCEPPYGGFDHNMIETLIVRCSGQRPNLERIEETRINWLGGFAALGFLVGTFSATAGLAGLIRPRPAAITTASCSILCLALVVVWFY